MDGNQPSTTLTAAGGTAGIRYGRQHHRLSVGGGELVLITDGTTADLYQTSAAGGTILTFGGVYSLGHAKLYPAGSTVAKARFARYFIDNTTDPAHPTLMVDRMGGSAPQPLADDIEDMQLTYAVDTERERFHRCRGVDPDSGQSVADPAGPAAIHRADASSGGGVVRDKAGDRKPGRRNDGGRLSPPDLRHRDRCPEFGSVTE